MPSFTHSSFTGPADIPSTGSLTRCWYSFMSLRRAVVFARDILLYFSVPRSMGWSTGHLLPGIATHFNAAFLLLRIHPISAFSCRILIEEMCSVLRDQQISSSTLSLLSARLAACRPKWDAMLAISFHFPIPAEMSIFTCWYPRDDERRDNELLCRKQMVEAQLRGGKTAAYSGIQRQNLLVCRAQLEPRNLTQRTPWAVQTSLSVYNISNTWSEILQSTQTFIPYTGSSQSLKYLLTLSLGFPEQENTLENPLETLLNLIRTPPGNLSLGNKAVHNSLSLFPRMLPCVVPGSVISATVPLLSIGWTMRFHCLR